MFGCCVSHKEEKHAVSALMELIKSPRNNSPNKRMLDSTRRFEGTKGQKNKTKIRQH